MKKEQLHELLYQALETEPAESKCMKPPFDAPSIAT
jgi:hypothetical protein